MFKDGTVVAVEHEPAEIAGYVLESKPGGVMLRMVNSHSQLARIWVPNTFLCMEVPGLKNLPGLLGYLIDRNLGDDRKQVGCVVMEMTKNPSLELDDVVKYLPLVNILPESILEDYDAVTKILVRLQPSHPDAIISKTDKRDVYEVFCSVIRYLPNHWQAPLVERVLIESKCRSLLAYAAEWIHSEDQFLRIARGPLAVDDDSDDDREDLNTFFEESSFFKDGAPGGNDFAARIALDATCAKPWRRMALNWFTYNQAGAEALQPVCEQLDDKDLRGMAEECRADRHKLPVLLVVPRAR